MEKGVKKVNSSAPAKDDTPTFVIGANEDDIVVNLSYPNASCTTNGLAPCS